MIFTVTWSPHAQEQLADLWGVAHDRDNVTEACAAIDAQLRIDPVGPAQRQPDGNYVFTVQPLTVYYVVRPLDCMVEVASVKRSDFPTNGRP